MIRVISVARSLTLAVVALAAAACLGETTLLTPHGASLSELTLTFLPDSEDLASATALGWQAALPAMSVTVTPADSSTAPQQLTSSPTGTVTLRDLADGDYVIDASRWLTDAERRQLPAGDDALGFATRATIWIGAASSAVVYVPASHRKSLVISEWSFNFHGYTFGGFLELHNNADTTVYLDGMLLARGFELAYDYPNFPCSWYTSITDDPDGIWARLIQEFPGTGRDYPVAPGQTIVIATDAIDHRELHWSGIDLRSADFEFTGVPDVDNPAVPNMIDVGLVNLEHGLRWDVLASVVVVALPADVAALPHGRPRPESTTDWVRVPREKILDALWIRPNYAGATYPECLRLVNRNFDRQGAAMRGTDEIAEVNYSLSRRILPFVVNGRRVLQHTRTGNADFIRTVRNPGTLQDP
jgi:hypothetical protein